MLSLPFIAPQDSHELWFGPSNPHRPSSQQLSGPESNPLQQPHPPPHRRNHASQTTHQRNHRSAFLPPRTADLSLSALQAEERNLRARKNTIACFGSSWIRPAGCAKTMLGMKEEEAEREEALAALAAEQEAAALAAATAAAGGMDADELGLTMGEEGEERDLDAEIPDADEEGLVEEGEEGFEEDGSYMERDLDDEIPEGYPGEDEEEDGYADTSGLYAEEVEEDFDQQPDLDADVPEAEGGSALDDYEDEEENEDGQDANLTRDLDDDIPDADQSGEWQHTDTEDEFDEDEENHEQSLVSIPGNVFRQRMDNCRTSTSTPNSRGLPTPPLMRRPRPSGSGETEAQRRFINRWSGGGDALDSSSMLYEEDDLRASITSQGSRRNGLARRYPRRVGGPRDSLD
ncbi:hypothetical protein POX_e06404 [Penicillium oxalicum]|uniref:hypothetical protein n=1 Tax=Penicillium oxalicum TaxID=69781 RepID=UPI0020B64955|nr:hypothetical protein POX_e06404 [Penicillium oxalicum]KAI2788389.1 hypothetical protein POX_e06404 [Penicillium oxalicum]